MNRLVLIVLFFCLVYQHSGKAQQNFYDEDKIQEIRIYFKEANWAHLLDSLIQAGDDRLMGDVTVNGTVFKDVGIRYKGFSSWNLGETKNPFNIELDYTIKNKNYQGFKKIKLSNVIHDPSFVREVLSYEIARKYMPASRSNFANVYVNDRLIGLYTNNESVDKEFTKDHFGSRKNPFFKGEPSVLQYPLGQNANLAYTHGTQVTGYMPYYNMESDTGWATLVKFIALLNQHPDSVDQLLNVDRALWMHAFNFVLVNLDSYIGYSQNFYIYQDDLGRFNTIPWDLNMSFGSFRYSDGSYHFNGLSIDEAKNLDPLEHLGFCITPRPLMKNLFADTHNKKVFLAHIRTILDENFKNGSYYTRGQELQSLITPSVLNDTNKFNSNSEFYANLTSTVGVSGSMSEYPGIRDLMEARIAYLDSYTGIRGEPQISDINHQPAVIQSGKSCYVTAKVEKATQVVLNYRCATRSLFQKTPMYDDGQHGDGATGDQVFGAEINFNGKILQYYIYADNDSAASLSPPRAEYEFYTLWPRLEPGDVVINEFMTSSGMLSDLGIPGNWVELYNNTREDIWLRHMFLSNDTTQTQLWRIPDTLMKAGSYLIILTDEKTSEPGLHASFTLSSSSSQVILSDSVLRKIDQVNNGVLATGKSIGRYPNGVGGFCFMPPSFSGHNLTGAIVKDECHVFPNPASNQLYVEFNNQNQPIHLMIFNSQAQKVFDREYEYTASRAPAVTEIIDVSSFRKGIYFIELISSDKTITNKFIIE